MMDGAKVRLAAAAALADMGVSLPLHTVLRRKPIRLTMRIPTTQSFIRISRLYNGMGIKADELEGCDTDRYMRFVAQHGKAVSRMVAYGVVRGPLMGWLLNRPVAWLLRLTMDPVALGKAWELVLSTADTRDFASITLSAARTDRLLPTQGQEGKTSQRQATQSRPIASSAPSGR